MLYNTISENANPFFNLYDTFLGSQRYRWRKISVLVVLERFSRFCAPKFLMKYSLVYGVEMISACVIVTDYQILINKQFEETLINSVDFFDY